MCNENLCAVAFILDRSGSMERMRDQAIAGFNDFLQSQIQYPGETRFSFTLFNLNPAVDHTDFNLTSCGT